MKQHSLSAFLQDPDAKVRHAAITAMANLDTPWADHMLAGAVADPDERVAGQALAGLAYRQPWLHLEPFPVRQAPEGVLETHWGQAWRGLRQGMREWLEACSPQSIQQVAPRWLRLPGTIPDLIELLNAYGFQDISRRIELEAGLYGQSKTEFRQILLAPTYQCNLNCSYCYAKQWDQRFPGHMSPQDLTRFLDWCQSYKIKQIILAGGEPTVYKHLDQLLKHSRELGIEVHMTSNCLYPAEVDKYMTPHMITRLIAHYDQEIMAEGSLRSQLFLHNLRRASKRGVPLLIRYTLTGESTCEEWKEILELAVQYGVGQLNYAFAFKNFLGNNDYFRYEPQGADTKMEKTLASLADDGFSMGVTLNLCKPVPLCSFSPKGLREFIEKDVIRSSCAAYLQKFSRNLTVNPDLSTFPCNALAIEGPRAGGDMGPGEIADSRAMIIKDLLAQPWRQECTNCLFFYRGFCYGACLAEKYGMGADSSE